MAGDGRLIAGETGPTVAALREDGARLADAGADVVLVLAPAVQPLRPEELVDTHTDVATSADVPTLVYHFPQYTGSELTVDAVEELAQVPGIVGMKDSSTDADRRARFAEATADTPFAVLTGDGRTLRVALEAGAAGSITAVANVKQRQVAALHRAVADGDEHRAEQLQTQLVHVEDGIGSVGASVPAALKAALQLEGVLVERWCVPPLRSVPGPHLDRVRTALLP
jgi:dihydrodipicolinate synthase/N-acetylneuraminate lyase